MVELSGMSVRDNDNADGDIAIAGLQPGEKLYEGLLIGDNPSPTEHPHIMKVHDDAMGWNKLRLRLAALDVALESNNVNTIRQFLQELVSGYQPAGKIDDWIYLENIGEPPQAALREAAIEEPDVVLVPAFRQLPRLRQRRRNTPYAPPCAWRGNYKWEEPLLRARTQPAGRRPTGDMMARCHQSGPTEN